jgi:hypothetical protein
MQNPNTPLSAISFVNAAGSTLEVRLYYISRDGYLSDAIFTSGRWIEGSLRKANIKPAPSSRLATTI